MNARLPPKPKIDLSQYLKDRKNAGQESHVETKIESTKVKPTAVLPPSEIVLPQYRSNGSSGSESLQSSPTRSPDHKNGHVTPNLGSASPNRIYAPKPAHSSIPIDKYQADHRAPSKVPISFVSNKVKLLLAVNERYLCLASNSKFYVYSWRSSSLVWDCKANVLSAAFVKETKSLWLGTVSGKIYVLDQDTGRSTQVLDRGHLRPVTHIFLSRAGIVTLSSDDGKLNIWAPQNVGAPFKTTRIRGNVNGKSGLAAGGGRNTNLIWLCKDKRVELYRPLSQILPLFTTTLTGRGANLGSVVSVCAIDDLAFFGQNDGFISIFNRYGFLGAINGGIHSITALAAPNRNLLWAGTRSGEVLVLRLEDITMSDNSASLSATLVRQWKAHESFVSQITCATHNSAVISMDRLGNVYAWNPTPSDILPSVASRNQSFRVKIVTWNVGACDPERSHLNLAVTDEVRNYDIVVFGLQEVVELENKSQHALNMVRPADFEQDKEHIKWTNYFMEFMAYHGFGLVTSKAMVGIQTCVFIRRSQLNSLSGVQTDVVKTGIGGAYGNKGGVSIRFTLAGMKWCFTNCHLAAGHAAIMQRNRDASQILIPDVLECDVCFFFGDTNYRISVAREQAEQLIKIKDWDSLKSYDQLTSQVSKIPSFALGRFQEGELRFPPTYKYDKGTGCYDTSDKKRVPSWCDRILYKGRSIRVIEYDEMHQISESDHRPVVGSFEVPLLYRGNA